MTLFKDGDLVGYAGHREFLQGLKARVLGYDSPGNVDVRFEGFTGYDDEDNGDGNYGALDYHSLPEQEFQLLDRIQKDAPEKPAHYQRLKDLTGVEVWDILDEVAATDPDMWNLGKYWFRCGHKDGQSSLVEKKKMLVYLERSIAKEEQSQ